jgi:hypothetical protein
MKRILCRLLAAGAVALALTGCGTQQLATEAVVGLASEAADLLTGPDTDYKNYLSACNKQVAAQVKAYEEESKALATAIASPNEKIQFGALILVAAKGGNGPRIGCSAERKKGWLEGGNVVDAALRLYEENRRNKRAEKQLESDEKRDLARMRHDQQMADRNNDLLTTLSGDKLELQRDARGASTAAD